MKLDSAVQTQLAAMVADEGLDLLATEVAGLTGKTILRLIVDGPDGVKLDQCASISRQASALLDVEEPITNRYTLEVSSPGLDRKFYGREDYKRFIGQQVKIRMAPSYRDHRTVVGQLIGATENDVCVLANPGEEIHLPIDQIFEARLEIDWNSIMKEGKSRP